MEQLKNKGLLAYYRLLDSNTVRKPQKSPDPSSPQVIQVGFLLEGFPFKTDVSVSGVVVAVPDPLPGVFKQVPDVKGQNQQFELLPVVDQLVVEQHRVSAIRPVLDQDERVQRHSPHV